MTSRVNLEEANGNSSFPFLQMVRENRTSVDQRGGAGISTHAEEEAAVSVKYQNHFVLFLSSYGINSLVFACRM